MLQHLLVLGVLLVVYAKPRCSAFIASLSVHGPLERRALSNNVLIQDLVYTSSVPEPGTLGIVGLGSVLIGLLRRKLNQN